MGAAILAACVLGGLPVAATAANSGGTVVNHYIWYYYVGNGSGDVVFETESDTYNGAAVTLGKVCGDWYPIGTLGGRRVIVGDDTHAPKLDHAYGTQVYGDGGGSVSKSELIIQNGTVQNAYGGGNTIGDASENRLEIHGGWVEEEAAGGRANYGNAYKNTVIITGGVVGTNGEDSVFGGRTGGHSAPYTVTENTVDISGGEVRGGVYGGWSHSGAATNNTVRLSGTPTLSSATLYGGAVYQGSGDVTTGNTLKVESKNLTVGGVNNFGKLAFTLPDAVTGGAMLTASGNANFPAASTEVDISVFGAPALNAGNEITLVAAGTLDIKAIALTTTTADYFNVARSTTDNNKLVASLHTVPQTRKVTGDKLAGGEVVCEHGAVWERIGITTCTAKAHPGYAYDADSIALVGSSADADCSGDTCALSKVSNDVTVTASFTLNEYSVSDATPTGAGGTMDCPTSKVTVLDTPTCTAKPELGYVFDKAMDISPVGAATRGACDDSGCTLTNVVDDVTVTGVFKKEDYNIDDITDRVKGRVTCDRNPVPYGESTRCDATPAAGYVFDGTMSVTGATLGACDATGCELTNAT
ncbi:MAG: hypothetical protein IJM64_05925, partial [Ottowia sp.]|nr:hypothetical protein [Ottowia sp.]